MKLNKNTGLPILLFKTHSVYLYFIQSNKNNTRCCSYRYRTIREIQQSAYRKRDDHQLHYVNKTY